MGLLSHSAIEMMGDDMVVVPAWQNLMTELTKQYQLCIRQEVRGKYGWAWYRLTTVLREMASGGDI